MKIPVAWIDVEVGDMVEVMRHRSPKRVESFGWTVTMDQDNRPHQERTVNLIHPETGRRTWAFAAEIRGKVDAVS